MVIALAGRRIDEARQPAPRFPLSNVGIVRERIRNVLCDLRPRMLVCSAGCGADLLALEVAFQLKMQTRVVLPFDPDEFQITSVADRAGDWTSLYRRVVSEVESRRDLVVLGCAVDDPGAYAAVNREIINQARVAATESGTGIAAVTVWDGVPHGNADMSWDFLRAARNCGLEIREVSTLGEIASNDR